MININTLDQIAREINVGSPNGGDHPACRGED
jgi:hypothetical protein